MDVPRRRGARHRRVLPPAGECAVDLLRRRRLLRRHGRVRRHGAQPAEGRAPPMASLRARAARPGGRRRDLRCLRGAAESRAAAPVDCRRLLSGRLSAACRRRVPAPAPARRPDEPRRDSRHDRHLLRGRARSVGLLHRAVQPHALRQRGRAARLDGLPGDGRPAARRARAAARRARGPHGRVSHAARERRPAGWSPTRSTA